jgi:uncharacterized membrane protein YkoI
MRRFFAGRLLGVLCLLLLFALNQGWHALAQGLSKQSQPLGDLSSFRTIAADTLAIVNTGNLTRARARIKDLENKWDRAEGKLRPRHPERWQIIDKAIDTALSHLRADRPQMADAKDALESLLNSLDRANQNATIAPAASATPESAPLFVTDIVAAAEKLQAGASVLDVSFEPKDGRPLYAVRTYGNGKVWDGLLDGATGAAIDQGIVMDESALDAEDKAELVALEKAKITLREAIASAEKINGGRALNVGLEQVRGRAVWEVLIQKTNQSQQVHIDPLTGKIL